MSNVNRFAVINQKPIPAAPIEEPVREQPTEAASPQNLAQMPRRPGRPNGKRSDPDYERMNLIVRKDTRRKVDMKLLQEGKSEDLSELVDRLLREWAG